MDQAQGSTAVNDGIVAMQGRPAGICCAVRAVGAPRPVDIPPPAAAAGPGATSANQIYPSAKEACDAAAFDISRLARVCAVAI